MSNNELTSQELAIIVKNARMAKIHGFSGFVGKFSEHRLVDIRVELSEPRENLTAIYKNHLTLATSCSNF
jgi:hypothetical protein